MKDNTAPIVAAIDGSAVSYRAGAWAAVDAALHRCPLRLVTSIGGPVGWGPVAYIPADDPWLRRDSERILAEALRNAGEAVGDEPLTVETKMVATPIVPYLLEQSKSARGMVVGSRGLGAVRRGLLGSTSTAVVREAYCPVTVVHDAAATDPVVADLPVLVGVDGGPTAIPALEFAFEEASRRKVEVTALHAWTYVSGGDPTMADRIESTEEAVFAESMAGWTERYPDVPVRRVMVRERPARALLDESERAQLVVIGSHGRGGFAGMLLGSVGNALVPSVYCPITVVRGPR